MLSISDEPDGKSFQNLMNFKSSGLDFFYFNVTLPWYSGYHIINFAEEFNFMNK